VLAGALAWAARLLTGRAPLARKKGLRAKIKEQEKFHFFSEAIFI
jgi:hypothetical protein